MKDFSHDAIRTLVRDNYGQVATSEGVGCGGSASACCTPSASRSLVDLSETLGYSRDDVEAVPEGSNMGLGCGNPQSLASLQPGEAVLDLGSGGGFDCFLAAQAVGPEGHVIGVDMTPEMVSKARANAAAAGLATVEFRLGEIEHLPVADASIDVILSNCVINLSPEKDKVFQEAFRVLKPGGRLAISDIVATAPLPEEVQEDVSSYTGCMAGASLIEDLNVLLEAAGFKAIRIGSKEEGEGLIQAWSPGSDLSGFLVSATIRAIKPAA